MLLAVREVLRAKVRFALLSAAVGLLVFLIVFQQGLLGGLITSFIGAVKNQDAPVLVFNDQARSNVEGSFLLPPQAAAVNGVEGVAATGLVGQGTFTAVIGADREDAVLFGYELGGLGAPTTLTEGRLPEAPNEAVASESEFDDGFNLGDTVTIVGEGGTDGPAIEIVGVGDDLQWSVAPTLFVSYDTFENAQRAVNPNAEVVLPSLVAVQPGDGQSAAEVAQRINSEVDGVEALTNEEAITNNPGVQGVSQSFNNILALAFAVIALVVAFFFLILTVQKAKPLTLLRALGAPSGYLVKNLIVQILIVMATGCVLGVGLAFLVANASGNIPITLEPSTVAVTVIGIFILALLGSLVSIRRVLRIDPIRATTSTGGQL